LYAEIERLKWHPPRPEPSRLEIAAMIYAGLGDHNIEDAIEAADALIAAAREGK